MTFTKIIIVITLFNSIALGAGLLACDGAEGAKTAERTQTVEGAVPALKIVCATGQSPTQVRHDHDPRCTGSGLSGSFIDYYCGTTLAGGGCEKRSSAPTK